VNHTAHVKVDVSALTTAEVDTYGYIKPGVPLLQTGLLVTAGYVFGVTIEPIKIAASNSSTDLGAATDCFVAVATIAQVSQDIIEDNLGRALTTAELAGFDLAGSKIALIRT
jgi:hypothetical protein